MAITIPAAEPTRVELEAAYRRAQQEEHSAARKLVDSSFDDEHYEQFMIAAEAVIRLRGELYKDGVWTQDGGRAVLTDWCNCTIQTDSHLYQRFNAAGLCVTHGTVCGHCRRVAQTG